jgi:protein-tyrosine kinase
MSRIHEALKRAEQERASREQTEAPPAPPAAQELILPPLTAQANEPPLPPPSREPEPFVPSFSMKGYEAGPRRFEDLIARCRQPDWNPDGNTMLFSKEENHQYKAEVFRTLRSRLYRIRDQMNLRTLLITSTLPAEGKSFIAANLGQAIAQQHGRRALLIDADLRVPRLHTLFGAPQGPGLTEYLLGEIDEFSAIQRGPRDGFFLMPCGSVVANPVELIGNGRLKELLDRLQAVFDWIILDSPPMTPVSDASLIADMCDGALLVVKAAATPFDLAQKACAEFKNTPLVGVVLNRIDRSTGYNGYYYSYYGSEPEKA